MLAKEAEIAGDVLRQTATGMLVPFNFSVHPQMLYFTSSCPLTQRCFGPAVRASCSGDSVPRSSSVFRIGSLLSHIWLCAQLMWNTRALWPLVYVNALCRYKLECLTSPFFSSGLHKCFYTEQPNAEGFMLITEMENVEPRGNVTVLYVFDSMGQMISLSILTETLV